MTTRRTSSGLSMVEVVVAVALLAILCIPVLKMGSLNVETTRMDRVRLEAEAICHDTLERFGRSADNVQVHLARTPGDRSLFEASDLWNRLGSRYEAMGHDRIALLSWRYDLHMKVRLKKDLIPGMDQLTCEVSWTDDRERAGRIDRVAYSRFIIHDHLH